MTNKTLAFVFLLLSTAVVVGFVSPAVAEGTIYIRSDGSVVGTDKIQRDGNVYTFIGNIYDEIVVERDNIVVDGAGYTIQGAETSLSKGIDMSNRSNVTTKDMEIKAFHYGIYLNSSSNNTVSRNYITNTCLYGIELWESSNNIISGNNVTTWIGILLHSSNYNIISDNNVITTRNGIFLEQRSDDNIISGNYITNNRFSGIFFGGSSNQIIGNYIANNGNGTYIFSPPFGAASSNNLIYNNSYVKNTRQIYIEKGFAIPDSINVWDNGVEGNYWSDYEDRYPYATELDDLGIWDTPYVIDENNQDNYPFMKPVNISAIIIPEFPDTTSPTVSIFSPENKTYTVTDVPLTFTVSEPTLWRGYSLDAEANVTIHRNITLTGLSDGTHSLTVYARDRFANTGSSEMVYFTVDTALPSISILSPQNKTYDTTDIPLTFTVNETTSWMGYSLDGQTNNTIAGNTTLTGLSNGSHSLTVYAKDIAGNTGTSETIYFSIAQHSESFPTLIAATTVIVAIAVVGVALLVYFAKVKKTTGKSEKRR